MSSQICLWIERARSFRENIEGWKMRLGTKEFNENEMKFESSTSDVTVTMSMDRSQWLIMPKRRTRGIMRTRLMIAPARMADT